MSFDSDNTLARSQSCPECGAMMLWTQNVWPDVSTGRKRAAYQCLNGHQLDPATTRQCPHCGVHDTQTIEHATAEQSSWICNRCAGHFTIPRQ